MLLIIIAPPEHYYELFLNCFIDVLAERGLKKKLELEALTATKEEMSLDSKNDEDQTYPLSNQNNA